MTLSTFAI